MTNPAKYTNIWTVKLNFAEALYSVCNLHVTIYMTELMEASQKRDLQLLVRAIAHAKKVNVNHEVDVQIILAEKLRDHLVKMEKLRHAVLDMEAKTIAEIKSYSNPPDGVHQCLTATFLLLGHQLKEVKVRT